MLAAYGVVAAYVYGLLMNLSGWPFLLGVVVPGHEQTALSFDPAAPLLENLQRFARLHPDHLDRLLRHRPRDHQRHRDRGPRPGRPHHAPPRRPRRNGGGHGDPTATPGAAAEQPPSPASGG